MPADLFGDRFKILQYFQSHGILVSPAALEMILKKSMGTMIPRMISDEIVSSGYLSEEDVRKLLRGDRKPIPAKFEISLPDIKVNSSVEDFRAMFANRFEKLSRMVSLSGTMRGSVDIKTAKKLQGEAKVVGMVSSIDTTKNGHKRLVIEDMEDSLQGIIMRDRGPANELILQDEVIGIVGSVSHGKGDPVIFVNEIIRPDIPYRVIDDRGKEPSIVGSISDIHVGSKTFRKDDFRRMVKWIESSEGEAQNLHYLILSGDVIDGIGVYPGQENDLELVNPMEQYGLLGELLQGLPDDIQTFIMPGNHDTVRLAEPQPEFSGKIKELLPENAFMLPNPYNLVLENRNVLIYHGMSLNDMVELVPGANFTTIGKAIDEILKRRHLSPKYGGKTPLIPSPVDYHVIEKVPDIFITGHIHSHYMGNYKGVRYVNSSTWQSQTEYQRMMNFAPNPSILSMFDLNSQSTFIQKFESRS